MKALEIVSSFTMAPDLTTAFEPAPGLEVSQMADGIVVYQPERERVHYLNPTAALVFDLCRDTKSPAAIAAYLQDAFPLAHPPHADVANCIQQLLVEGLIRSC